MGNEKFLAEKLKEARKAAKMSAADAGAAVGRSDKTIYAWENGLSEPSAEQLMALCRAYGVDITYFYPPDYAAGQYTNIERTIVERFRSLSDDDKVIFYGLLEILCKK